MGSEWDSFYHRELSLPAEVRMTYLEDPKEMPHKTFLAVMIAQKKKKKKKKTKKPKKPKLNESDDSTSPQTLEG